MQWQLSLALLAQPTFDPDSSMEKAELLQELMQTLSGEKVEDVPMDDGDTVALLQMAGRRPIRIINASTGNASDNS